MEMKENTKKIKAGSLYLYYSNHVLVLEKVEQTYVSGILYREPDKFFVLFPDSSVDIVSEDQLVTSQL